MIIEASVAGVAVAAMGLSALIVRKSARRDELNAKKDERFADSLDKNTFVYKEMATAVNELKIYLVGLNGKNRKRGD